MHILKHTLAATWGRTISSYSQWTLEHAHFVHDGTADVPAGPVIWAGWHATNLIALAALPRLFPSRTWHAVVAPGLAGVVMSHWLKSVGPFQPMVLEEKNMKAAITQMTRSLRDGYDLVIAVDGPHGPAGSIRPGALWLARRSGCPIVPGAFAARPGPRLPRWDRLLVPLPGGRISAAFGMPMHVASHATLDGTPREMLRTALETTSDRAWALLDIYSSQRREASRRTSYEEAS
jgi:lysophospholipid acyltransferase (LPLAT)-like uncharacterized protein